MTRSDIDVTAQTLVAEGKGILTANESTGTIAKRFDAIDVEPSVESRRPRLNREASRGVCVGEAA